MIDIARAFETHIGEFYCFERIETMLNPRPDLNAFLLLDSLVPKRGIDMVSGASRIELYLSVDCDELAANASESDIVALVRCGVLYDSDKHCLTMVR